MARLERRWQLGSVLALLIISAACWPRPSAAHPQQEEEQFEEEAAVTPLPDGLVLVHFHFTQSAPFRRHYTIFPKAVGQLVAAIPFDDLQLSLSQGQWHYQRWGEPLLHAKPAGAELRTAFSPALAPEQLPGLWGNLSHALGGLFCASLNFVARPEATAAEAIAMAPSAADSGSTAGAVWAPAPARQHVLYAALPQEASCTENLTPWLKLLPCRDAAGLGKLLVQRGVVFGADYHSIQVSLRVQRDGALRPLRSTLTQSLSLVLRPPAPGGAGGSGGSGGSGGRSAPQPGSLAAVDLSALLGAELQGACPVARRSRLFLKLPGQLRGRQQQQQQQQQQQRQREEEELLQAPAHEPEAAPAAANPQHKGGAGDPLPGAGAAGGARADGGADSAGEAAAAPGSAAASGADGEAAENAVPPPPPPPGRPRRPARWQTAAFTLRPGPDAVAVLPSAAGGALHVIYSYDLRAGAGAAGGAGEGPAPLATVAWEPGAGAAAAGLLDARQPRFHASRYITGGGSLHGGMVLQLTAAAGAGQHEEQQQAEASSGRNVSVCIFQTVPWYVRLWLHTLQLSIDGQPASLDRHLTLRHVHTAEDRARPLVLHLCLDVPPRARSLALSAHFTKAFLTAFEHPPDAYRGFDVPAAVVTLGGAAPGAGAAPGGAWRVRAAPGAGAPARELEAETPLMRALAEARPQQVYSPGLVVPLAVPDFSMPYNVICLTSTVLAVFLGATLNVLLLRPGQAERRAAAAGKSGRSAARAKALKLAAVTVVFGGLAVYLDPSLQEALADAAAAVGLPVPAGWWGGVTGAGGAGGPRLAE